MVKVSAVALADLNAGAPWPRRQRPNVTGDERPTPRHRTLPVAGTSIRSMTISGAVIMTSLLAMPSAQETTLAVCHGHDPSPARIAAYRVSK